MSFCNKILFSILLKKVNLSFNGYNKILDSKFKYIEIVRCEINQYSKCFILPECQASININYLSQVILNPLGDLFEM